MRKVTQPIALLFIVVAAVFGQAAQRIAAGDDVAKPTAPMGAADFRPSVEHPVGWRGDGSGQYPSAHPPTKWSAKENIVWKAQVGMGTSSPVLVGRRVFVTAEPDLLICLDAGSGKELWRKAHNTSDLPAAKNAKAPIQRTEYGDANAVPVSDGKWIWVTYGTGITACYDLDGKARWVDWFDFRRTTQYARTASPVLIGERLLVHFGPLVCLDAATGKVLWKNEKAEATYGTPAPARIGDEDIVVTPSGDAVRVSDGALLASDLGRCAYSSPLVQGNIVYFIDKSISAVRLPEKSADQFEGKELWFEDLSGEFYASPIIHDGRIYAVNRSAEFFVIDAKTGKTQLQKTLDLPPAGRTTTPNVYPSICLAGKHLFVGNDAGEAVMVELGNEGKAGEVNSLPAGSGSTPVFADKRIYVRGGRLLYCIGAQ
jgi:outer membrane protein assembly factor BamB